MLRNRQSCAEGSGEPGGRRGGIVLVGLMGAGKSAIGRRLAAELELPFRDSDHEVEAAAGCSIADLFASHGEASFRDGERRVIARLLETGPVVLATGGGAFMDARTRAAIRASGAISVWLRCDLPTLLRRTAGRTHRPLLAAGDPAEILAQLVRLRHPIYAEADIIVDCDDSSQERTTARVLDAILAYQAPVNVPVSLADRSYQVTIGGQVLARAGGLLAPVLPSRLVALVADATVLARHGAALRQGLAEAEIAILTELPVAPGEASKSLDRYATLVSDLLSAGVDRATTVLAFGGGVVGDLAGFAAATCLRGLPFVQVPTTLLAQVDSSVGGKTGVNTAHGKNLVGAFHQPIAVLADTDVLATLPVRELRAGYAEIVKAALIGDAGFFTWCERHAEAALAGDAAGLRTAIARAVAFKAQVVADDETELRAEGGRALLNLGHTFGHALEAELGYGTLLHGEAVAVGLGLAFRLSARLGLCPPGLPARIEAHLAAVGLPVGLRGLGRALDAEALISRFGFDKKMRGGKLNFVLATDIGAACTRRDVPDAAVRDILHEAGAG